MPFAIISELTLRKEAVDDGYAQLRAIIDGTRSFPGCRQADVLVAQRDASKVTLVVSWDSPADYDRYHEWRMGDGAANLAALLAEPSDSHRYELVN